MKRLSLLDKTSLLATLALALSGIVLVRSATLADSDSILWIKQSVWVSAGFVLYLFISRLDYKKLVSQAGLFYMAAILSLILVLIFGDKINGARSWFRLPFMSIQPSEFAKIATVLMVTNLFSKLRDKDKSFWEFSISAILVAIPFGLIVLQPDLGTALVFLPLCLIPNFLVGNKESIWVTAIGTGLAVLLIAGVVFKPGWVFFLKDYQKDRIVSFIYPERDTSNIGYQVHQSKISIGQGGLLGSGFGKGQQTRLGFLPAQHNDFILAVAAEEFGFVGIFAIFGLFLTVFLRGFVTAGEASDAIGSCLTLLVIGTLFVQTLFNASMMIGMVPTTGIPCPLLSYGGSSCLTTMSLLGLIQSVRTHRFIYH